MADPLQEARAHHPSAGGCRTNPNRATPRPSLGPTDWTGIEHLLSEDKGAIRLLHDADRLVALEQVLGKLQTFANGDRIVGATYVRDLLLDVWSAAHPIDWAVARPAEDLMTNLVGCDVVSADEIQEVCDHTRQAASACRSAFDTH